MWSQLLRGMSRRGIPGTLGFAIAAVVVVLFVNLVLLIYAVQQPSTSLGTRILYQGDCDAVATRSTAAHLAINVLGTLVLAASNAAMQCVTAPTRADIDRTHARGSWLDIGIGSVRNIWHIGMRRQLLWGVLLLTSLPLHLLYNSVFIQSSSASAYYAILATQDFAQGAAFNNASYGGIAAAYNASDSEILGKIQREVHTYTHLSYEDCMSAYTTPFVKGKTNVVLISNITSVETSKTNSSVLLSTYFSPYVQTLNYSLFYPTDTNKDPDDYIFRPYVRDGTLEYKLPLTEADAQKGYLEVYAVAQIESCLSQKVAGACRVEFYVPFMAVVVICNLLKLCCFAAMFYGFAAFTPLITIGDAISSFLARPDTHTEGGMAIWLTYVEGRAHVVRQHLLAHGKLSTPRAPWKGSKYGHGAGVGAAQGGLTFVACMAWAIGGAVLIGMICTPNYSVDYMPVSLAQVWANGFGNTYPQNILASTVSRGIAANTLLANVPQVVLSIFYLFYNQDLTTMCITAEMAAFGTARKSLRVTSPSGKQRSTYWLGMPYRYSIPLLATSAVMHWAASQGVFLSEISVVDTQGNINQDQHIDAVGFSLVGLMIMYIIGWILIIATIVIRIWRLPSGIPAMGSCSLAISAACHGQGSQPVDAERPLQYGVTEITGDKTGRVGFSDEHVEALRSGCYYNGPDQPVPPEKTMARRRPHTESAA